MADTVSAGAACFRSTDGLRIWLRWILANVVGEVVGFGLAGVTAAVAFQAMERYQGLEQIMAGIAAILAVGCLEGGAVGLAQWLVLRVELAPVTGQAWIGATVAGATVAWGVGMIIGTQAGDVAASDVSVSPLVGALVIGVVAGALLSSFQWPVLRRAVRGAGWWVPAHAAAWSVGMVVAFLGIGCLPDDASVMRVVLVSVATGLGMGLVVAALTGLVLIWLLGRPWKLVRHSAGRKVA